MVGAPLVGGEGAPLNPALLLGPGFSRHYYTISFSAILTNWL